MCIKRCKWICMLCKCRVVIQICHHWSWHTVWLVLRKLCIFLTLSSNLALTWRLREVGTLGDTGTPAVNGGTKVPISSCDMWAVIVGAVVGAVTPIFVETGMAIFAPTACWYTSTHWRGECPCNLCLWWGLQWLWWHGSTSIDGFSHYLQSFTT